MNRIVFIMILIAAHASPCAGELRMIIAPRSTILTDKGYITFDLYLYNDDEGRVSVPAPEREFTIFWRVRDVDNVRSETDDSHLIVGTDTVKKYILGPHDAIRCELGEHFLTQPGDVVEFYVSVDLKSASGKKTSIRSNTVALLRPKKKRGQI